MVYLNEQKKSCLSDQYNIMWVYWYDGARPINKLAEILYRQNMELIHLNKIDNSNIKIANSIKQFNSLIKLLNDKNLTLNVIKKINDDITELNSSQVMGTALSHLIKKKQNKIIKLTEKELKIVPKNYYRNLWMVLGMSAFGLPLGVAFGLSLGNIGLLAIGLPIGMAIGTLVGSKLDKKALESGKQLDIELK